MEMTWRGKIVSRMTEDKLRETIREMGAHIQRLQANHVAEVDRSVRLMRACATVIHPTQ